MNKLLTVLKRSSKSPALAMPSRTHMRRHPLLPAGLHLAPVEPADGPGLWRAVNSSRATLSPWLPWVAFNIDPASSQRFAESCAREWDQGRALRFSIRHEGAREFLGIVSLDNCVHLHRNCSLGYWLTESATRQGIMTHAARACLAFGFEDVGFHRIACAAATENRASLRVIEKLGFRSEGTAREAEFVGGRWVDHALFSLIRGETTPAGNAPGEPL